MIIDINKKLNEREIAKESKRLIETMSLEKFGQVDSQTGMMEIRGELLAELIFLAVDVAMHFNE